MFLHYFICSVLTVMIALFSFMDFDWLPVVFDMTVISGCTSAIHRRYIGAGKDDKKIKFL